MLKRLSLHLVLVSTLIFSGCIIKGKVVDGNGIGLGGVTVTLSGDASMTTTTNSNGNYRFGTLPNMLSAGSYTVIPSCSGCSFIPPSKNIAINTLTLEGSGDVPGAVGGVDFTYSWECQDDDEINGIYRICNYLPLEPGNQWIYTTGDRIVLNETYTSNGYSGIKFATTTYDNDTFMQNRERGLLANAKKSHSDNQIFEFNPPIVFIKGEMRIGESVNQSFTWPDLSTTLFETTLEGIETITVPSGEYQTLKFLIKTEDVGEGTYNTYFWFAKGIGIIKIVRTNSVPPDNDGCMFICHETNMGTPAELVSAIVDGNNY